MEQARIAATLIFTIFDYSHIFTSPLQRCEQTAQIITASVTTTGNPIPIITDGRLIERDYGSLEGLPYDQTTDARKQFLLNQASNPHNIETDDQLRSRLMPFFHEVYEKFSFLGLAVIVCTHSGIMRFLLNELGHTYADPSNRHISPCAVCVFKYKPPNNYSCFSSNGIGPVPQHPAFNANLRQL